MRAIVSTNVCSTASGKLTEQEDVLDLVVIERPLGHRVHEHLDVLGTVESQTGNVALFVVNRNAKSSQAASIRLSGFSPARDVKVLTLAAPSLLDKNDEERPNAVRPAESHEVLRGNTLQRVFPAGSVTVCLFWGSGNDGGLASAASGPRAAPGSILH